MRKVMFALALCMPTSAQLRLYLLPSYNQVMIYAKACKRNSLLYLLDGVLAYAQVLSQSNAGLATSVSTSAVRITDSTGLLELNGF